MKKISHLYIYTLITGALLCSAVLTGCTKLVEGPAPVSSINVENVFSNDETAVSTLTGIYTIMSATGSPFGGSAGLSLRAGLSADEWTLSTQATDDKLTAYYRNNLLVSNTTGSENWEPLYKFIFYANSAIEGLNASSLLTASVKKQLLGEAKFVRAFCYFYLTNQYGDLPLVLSSDYKQSVSASRTPQVDIYAQMVTDLKEAQVLLNNNWLNGSLQPYASAAERVRPTSLAATALLARVYLYQNDYANAEAQATALINNTTQLGMPSLTSSFLKTSTEAIWQLQPTAKGWNTEDARVFVINAVQGNDKPVYLSQSLRNSFITGDARLSSWVKDTTIGSIVYPYAYKYKLAKFNDPLTEYNMALRLGEQYLIRAEARAQLNNISGSQSDLNVIRTRAGLANTAAIDKASLLAAILQERRVELFGEWGHRWFDLKRTGQVNTVMSTAAPLKGGVWQANKQLYPIPLSDIEKNRNLTQNPGY
jgi:hypothetical protein